MRSAWPTPGRSAAATWATACCWWWPRTTAACASRSPRRWKVRCPTSRRARSSTRHPPAFRADDYAGGLNAAVDQLMARIAAKACRHPTPSGARPDARPAVGRAGHVLLRRRAPHRRGADRHLRAQAGLAAHCRRGRRCRLVVTASVLLAAGAGVAACCWWASSASAAVQAGWSGWPATHRRLGRRRWIWWRWWRRWRIRRRWTAAASRPAAVATSVAAAPRETGDGNAGCASSSTAGSTRPTPARALDAPRCATGARVASQRTRHSGEIRSVRRGRAAAVLPVAPAPRRASARSRCSASCACGTPSTTTAC
jgi:hypothetical protein